MNTSTRTKVTAMTRADLYVRMPSCSSALLFLPSPHHHHHPFLFWLKKKKKLKKKSSQAGTLGQYTLTFPTESRNKATEKRTRAYIMAGRVRGVSSWMTQRCEKILRGVGDGWEWGDGRVGHSKIKKKIKKKSLEDLHITSACVPVRRASLKH